MQEMAGRTDHLALKARGTPQGKGSRFAGGELPRAGLHEEGVQVLFRFVAVVAELGIVPGGLPESDCFPGVHAEARGSLVTEKAELRVVRVGC
jgi:hypothetical protein